MTDQLLDIHCNCCGIDFNGISRQDPVYVAHESSCKGGRDYVADLVKLKETVAVFVVAQDYCDRGDFASDKYRDMRGALVRCGVLLPCL